MYCLGRLGLGIAILCSLGFAQEFPIDPPKALYKIEAEIDLDQKVIKGKETIRFINNSSRPMTQVAISWSEKDDLDFVILMNNKSLRRLNPDLDAYPLVYELPRSIGLGEEIALEIPGFFSRLNGDLEEIELNWWSPRLYWDSVNVHAAFEVTLKAPHGYAMVVSGRWNEEKNCFENQGAKSFGVYLRKNGKLLQEEVDGVLISAVHTEKGFACANYCFEIAKDVVSFYKKWLGFFPFTYLNIIPGMDYPAGGYPFAPGIVVIHGQERFRDKPKSHWRWITAHEIGHEYFGEYVMDGDYPSWLWIGLGIYADREYMLYKDLGLKRHQGFFSTYLKGVHQGLDTTVDIPPEQFRKIRWDHNNIVTHGKSYSIISALESVVGKPCFQKIYKRCLKEYGGKRLGYCDFWRLCEKESGQSLDWFFDQWVRSNKLLSYEITSQEETREGEEYVTTLVVERIGDLSMPVLVRVVSEDGSVQDQVTNRLIKKNRLIFRSKSKCKEAKLDPLGHLAMMTSDIPLDKMIAWMPYDGAGKKAIKAYEKAKEQKMKNWDHWFKLGMALYDGKYYDPSLYAFTQVAESHPSKMDRFTALVWLGHLKDLAGDRKAALDYYRKALANDVGGSMQHSQYKMHINRKWVEERIKTPFVRK